MVKALGHTSLLDDDRPGRIGAMLGRIAALGYRIAGKHRYDDFRLERVGPLRLLVLPSVANPRLLRTGAWFASLLDERLISPGTSLLDLGTGSGVCALFVAGHSSAVVATDINPTAIRCARINAMIAGMDQRIEFYQGDLFEPVKGRRFDIVLFNPPFLIGTPKDDREAAWRGRDIAARFAEQLSDHLEPGGMALLLLSTFGDASAAFEAELVLRDFRLELVARRRFVNETLFAVRVTRSRECLEAA